MNIRLNENKRVLPQDVQNLYLNSNKTNANGQNILVPLSAVATTQEKLGASQINRRDLEREVLIEANTSGRPSGDIGQDIDKMQKHSNCQLVIPLILKGQMPIWLNLRVMH